MFTIVIDASGVDAEMPSTGFQGEIERDRLSLGTDSRLRARLSAIDDEDLERHLADHPVLWSPEHMEKETDERFAYIGRFDRLRLDATRVRYTFKPYSSFPAIPVQYLRDADDFFRLGKWGWHRTKLVVTEDDFFEALGARLFSAPSTAEQSLTTPALFNVGPKPYDKLVSVMMPFTLPNLEPVFAKIDRELARVNIHCERADTDLHARRIIDKVATLIYNADAVICDFTSTNPNVFYEAGLAHAWSKVTIFIAQEGTALPFDTRDEATIFYENTELGLKELWYQIRDRLHANAVL